NCTNLSKVLIPSSVQTIGSAAFAYCTSLKEVTCLAPIPPTCGELVLNIWS
ncbi:MAG: leucine-rich repeat protein, partial [Alistipes sp.]|nr:leucine-rich repeat protein [Alistipes sp.]